MVSATTAATIAVEQRAKLGPRFTGTGTILRQVAAPRAAPFTDSDRHPGADVRHGLELHVLEQHSLVVCRDSGFQ